MKRKSNKKSALTIEQQKEYFRAVERVNKQLQRLEKHAQKTGSHITDYAYRILQSDIKQFFGKGRKRFSRTDVPRDYRSFIARMNAIQNFYKMPTSTISGEKKIYEKRAKTLSNKIGVQLSGDQLRRIFESGLFDQLMRYYGSATSLEVIGEMESQKEDLIEQLNKGKVFTFTGDYSERLNEEELDDEFNDVMLKYLKG